MSLSSTARATVKAPARLFGRIGGSRRAVAVGVVASVVGSLLAVVAVSAPVAAGAASRQAWGWGNNHAGVLANGTTTDSQSPTAVAMPTGVSFTAIAAGDYHGLALDTSGHAWGWGDNSYGELGNGTLTTSTIPTAVSMPAGVTFTAIRVDQFMSLALDSSGHAWGWGENLYGQLGDGTSNDRHTPTAVSMPAGVTFTDIGAGDDSAVALDSSGHAWAWGYNGFGNLGNGTYANSTVPTAVSMPAGVTFTTIGAGLNFFGLALDTSGHAWAWGYNDVGELGNGTTTSSTVPTAVSMPAGVTFTTIGAGVFQSLALDASGHAWAWGSGTSGQLGNGTTTDSHSPTPVSMPTGVTFSAIVGGDYHGLALDPSGHAWAWGANTYGQLGNGTTTNSTIPIAVSMPTGVTFASISASEQSNLALAGVPSQTAAQLVAAQGGPVTVDSRSASEPCLACQAAATAQPPAGDPLNTATGNFFETNTDSAVPGGGVPLGFSRSYDAQLAQRQVTAAVAPSALGYGWSYNLGMSISYNPTTQLATITEENSAQVGFAAYVSGTSPAWCTGATNFCPGAPRAIATLNHNVDGTWTFTRQVSGKTVFGFSAGGVLTSMADANGATLTVAAGSPGAGRCPSSAASCTVWTSSASGRALTLVFDSSARLTAVVDPAGNTAGFCFYGQTCAPSSGGGPSDLYSVTDLGTVVTSYGYDTANTASSLRHDVVTMTSPGGGVVTNSWDGAGRVTQQQNPHGTTTLAYTGDNASFTGGTTTVTTFPTGTGTGHPSDAVRYQYSSGVLVGQTTGFGTATPSIRYWNREPVSLLATSILDGNGNVTSNRLATYGTPGGTQLSSANITVSTDPAGNTTQTAYNTVNQPWCHIDAADYLNGTRCPSTIPTSPPAPGAADPNLGATISFYNVAAQLLARTDPLGNSTTHAYTATGLGVPAGLAFCTVDPADYQAGVACPAYAAAHVNGTAIIGYDAAGDPTSSVDAVGNNTATKLYNDAAHPGLVSQSTDADGSITTYTYDGAGRPTRQTVTFRSYTATTLSAYDSAGRKYCQVDPLESAQGVVCPGSPPSASNPPAGVTSDFYDAAGRVIQVTAPTGATTQSGYDQAGELFCTVAAHAYARAVRCPAAPPTTAPTPGADPYLGATIDTFDPSGRVVQETNALGGITLNTYDLAGNVTQKVAESDDQTNAPPVTTVYRYDADNRLSSTTLAFGTALAATIVDVRDPNGNIYCSVSANTYAQGPSSYQCPTWQPSWVASPPNPAALYSATPNPAQAKAVTTSFHDGGSLLRQRSNPDMATTVNAYDADGRAYCTASATNITSWLTAHPTSAYPYLCPTAAPGVPPAPGSNPGYQTKIYDRAGRLASDTDAAANTTAYSYDPAGKQLTVTDARNDTTTNCYYRQTATCAAAAPTAGGSASSLYATTTPPTQQDPTGKITTYTYVAGGAAATTTTPAGVETDGYDQAGNLQSVAYTGTASGYGQPTNESYLYNPDGSRQSITDGTGSTSSSYDDTGNQLTVTFAPKTGTALTGSTVSHSYYANGQTKTITYPPTGGHPTPTVTRTYNTAGQLASVTDWLAKTTTFGYDPDGHPTTAAYPNTTTTNAAYNLGGAPTSVNAAPTANPLAPFAKITYQPNPAEQVGSETDTGALAATVSYGYDSADRLATVNTTTTSYDAANNPTQLPNGTTQTFNTADELTAATGPATNTAFGYNTAGDRTSTTVAAGKATSYRYDQTSQLTAVAPSSSYAATVQADGPVSYWRLGESSGTTAVDASGSGHTGTYVAGPTLGVSGPLAGDAATAVGFNAANGQQVTTAGGSDFAAQAPFSMEVWINPTGPTPDWQEILAKEVITPSRAGYSLWYHNGMIGATRSVGGNLDEVATGASVPTGAWTHVAATYDGTTIRVYLNGALAASGASAISMTANTAPLTIATGINSAFNGSIAEAAIYNKALTAARISVHHTMGVVASPYAATVQADGPVSYWRLGESSGTTAVDASGSGHTGTYVAGPTLGVSGPLAGDAATAVGFNAANGQQVTTAGGSDFAAQAPFSMEVWINPTGPTPDWQEILAKEVITPSRAGYSLWYHNGMIGATRSVGGNLDEVATGASVPTGAWTHVAATYDGTTIRVYLNGALAASGASAISMTANTAPLTLATGINSAFNGSIAEAAIYNKALTAARINLHYTTGNVAARTPATYTYNGDGLRMSKQTPTGTQTFAWDTTGSLPQALTDGANNLIYGPNSHVVEQIDQTGTPLYLVADQLGSPRILTDTSGTVAATYTYDPYGNLTAKTGSATTPVGFASGYTDAETGLIYLVHRYYDPATNLFLSTDPLVAKTRSAYGYVGDNPLNSSDPTGLDGSGFAGGAATSTDPWLARYLKTLFRLYNANHNEAVRLAAARVQEMMPAGLLYADVAGLPSYVSSSGLRPDIVDFFGGQYYYWEVKPNTPYGQVTGIAQLAAYDVCFAGIGSRGPSLGDWSAPMTTTGGLSVHDSGTPGLIYYEKNQHKLIHQAQIEANAVMASEKEEWTWVVE
jgi:RHS repeat-associated protein